MWQSTCLRTVIQQMSSCFSFKWNHYINKLNCWHRTVEVNLWWRRDDQIRWWNIVNVYWNVCLLLCSCATTFTCPLSRTLIFHNFATVTSVKLTCSRFWWQPITTMFLLWMTSWKHLLSHVFVISCWKQSTTSWQWRWGWCRFNLSYFYLSGSMCW